MSEAEEAFVAFGSPWKAVFVAAALLLLVVVSAPEAFRQAHNEQVVADFLFLVLIFALMAAATVLTIVRRKSHLLRIDRDGVWAEGWERAIPWSGVSRVGLMKVRRGKFLYLHLSDLSAYPSSREPGSLARVNHQLGLGDLLLPTSITNRKLSEIINALRHHAPASVEFDVDLAPSRV